ncbi:hypothetical protein JCM12298_22770 [Desulfothermus naphthae]
MGCLNITNEEIADKLEELANYLELEGGDIYKIRAYKNAAQVIRGIGEDLCEMVKQGKDLKAFSGIGRNIENKIIEIVKTGDLTKLKKLRLKYPKDILKLLNIHGLGIKKIKTLCESLNITSLKELLDYAEKGRIKSLPGFGVKLEKKIFEYLKKFN